MTLSELCIRRPVMTTLITASIIAFGVFGFRLLPVPRRHLFLEGRPDEVLAQTRRLQDGQSILDTVRDQAQGLKPKLGASDREARDPLRMRFTAWNGRVRL